MAELLDIRDHEVATRPILVVDDEPSTRVALCRLLGHDDCDGHATPVLSAGSAREALRVADEEGDGLAAVVLDVHLLDGDGIDVARRLRPIVGHECRIVLLTGDHSLGTLRRSAGLSASGEPIVDAFLGKPVNVAALRDALDGGLG